MANYFNTLNLREKLDQLGRCRFMDRSEFADGCNYLKGKKIVLRGNHDYWWNSLSKISSRFPYLNFLQNKGGNIS